MTIEAMKLALEALENLQGLCSEESGFVEQVTIWTPDAIYALRTAIEQAEKQEPRCAVIVEVFGKDWRLDYMSLPVGKHRLYTQEYVYTTPPAAQRKPLTDEQRRNIVRANKMRHDSDEIDPYGVIDDVEAAHGITGEKT